MLELAIETSGRVGSVALAIDGRIAALEFLSGVMRHSAELWPTVEKILQAHHLQKVDRVYGTIGPGSFTGIRIGVTFLKMIGFAWGCQVVAVDSLDALAEHTCRGLQAAGRDDVRRLLCVLDAKQGRFFVSLYDIKDGKWLKIMPSSHMAASDILDIICRDKIKTAVSGEGLVYYAGLFDSPHTEILDKSLWVAGADDVYWAGRRLADAGQFANIDTLVPNYIRLPDAVEKRQTSG